MLLLVASHSGVLWLGLQGQAGTSARAAAKPESKATAEPEHESPAVADLLRKAEAREEKADEDYDKAQAKRAAEVAAAKAKIPADADPAAMVMAGTKGQNEVSAETVAAFGLWIDRDPVAALRWFGTWDPKYASSDFDPELQRHLEAGGLAMVDHYLQEAPLSRGCLFHEIKNTTEDRGPDFALDLAGGLSDPEDRLELLNTVFSDPEELKGKLAKIRGMLPDHEANALVEGLEDDDAYTGVAEELHQAGFPADLLASLDARHAPEEEESTGTEEDLKNDKELPRDMAERIRLEVANGRPDRLIYYDAEFREMVPDFHHWCRELEEGRIPPQEVIARMQAVVPGSEALGDQLRSIVLQGSFGVNPRQALEWLRSTGGEWQESFRQLVRSAGYHAPPELLESVVRDAYAGEEVPASVEDDIVGAYGRWSDYDPQGCRDAMEKMPVGSLRQKLEAALKGKEAGK